MSLTAIVHCTVVTATCPKCGDDLVDPYNGSYLISIPDHYATDAFECNACGKSYWLPKALFKAKAKS